MLYFYHKKLIKKMMEDIAVLNKSGIKTGSEFSTYYYRTRSTPKKLPVNPTINYLKSEGAENFMHFVKYHGLANELKMLVIPSNHHYYYEEEELKDVEVIINLKKLNLIKHLDMFLNSFVHNLPSNANFFGCFSDNNSLKFKKSYLYHTSRLYSRFINFIDSKTDNFMNSTEVTLLLRKHGLRIVDMKEMAGLTYFYCKR
jgi:hypothetical protein